MELNGHLYFNIKKKMDRLLRWNYLLYTKARYYRYLRSLSRRPPLIIFQMGKVGSTSVLESLKACNVGYELFHVHVLSHEWIKKVNDQYRKASKVHGRSQIGQHVLESMYLRTLLDRQFETIEWKIITIVRDPVARNISTFFQALPIYFPELHKNQERDALSSDLRLPGLVSAFEERFEEHDTPLTWFETHLKPVFGIDVYQKPFPNNVGYQIIQHKNVGVLVMRLEDLERNARKGFKEFIGVKNFTIHPQNISESKPYADIYKKFKLFFKPSNDYLNRMYNSRYMRHFYSPNEILKFQKNWEKSESYSK